MEGINKIKISLGRGKEKGKLRRIQEGWAKQIEHETITLGQNVPHLCRSARHRHYVFSRVMSPPARFQGIELP